MEVEFVKMHGLGNDFVVIDGNRYSHLNLAHLARKCLDRHFGIGGDGLLVVGSSMEADISMRVFNPDGSEAQMCGNGIRCVARYASDCGMVKGNEIRVQTLAGIRKVWLTEKGIKVDMGIPRLHPGEIPVRVKGETVIDHPLKAGRRTFKITCVSMGNPHCVIFMDADEKKVTELGPLIENHRIFPERTNVEFVKVINRKKLEVKVWERGAGLTLACGTGACASLVASHLKGLTEREAEVHLPGGKLFIEIGERGHVFMTGPAEYVFAGKFPLKE